MSFSYSLGCPETGLRICVGQGWSSMTGFYSGEMKTMERMRRFLVFHEGKPLLFLRDQRDHDFDEFKEFEPEDDDG